MSLNSRDNQAEKTKATSLQTKASFLTFDESKVTKKAKEKAKKEKKRREHQGQQNRQGRPQDGSPAAIGTYATPAIVTDSD